MRAGRLDSAAVRGITELNEDFLPLTTSTNSSPLLMKDTLPLHLPLPLPLHLPLPRLPPSPCFVLYMVKALPRE